jgi:hypothetical protein
MSQNDPAITSVNGNARVETTLAATSKATGQISILAITTATFCILVIDDVREAPRSSTIP